MIEEPRDLHSTVHTSLPLRKENGYGWKNINRRSKRSVAELINYFYTNVYPEYICIIECPNEVSLCPAMSRQIRLK